MQSNVTDIKPLKVKKNWQAFCREFQKTFDYQQTRTQRDLLLESITRALGEQIKTLALQKEQMARKAYVNNELIRAKCAKKMIN